MRCTYPGSRNVCHRVGGLGGNQGEGLVQGVPGPGDHALVQPLPQVHGAHSVAGDGHPVVADLRDQTWHQAERPASGLTVGDHEPGEHERVVRAGRAGERAAVPGQQRGRQDLDLLADDPHVHPPLGQVAPVNPDRHPGLPDTIEGGQQDVEVVDDLVAVGQERPRRPSAVLAAQAAEQEPPVVGGQPAVDVRVVQAGLLLAHFAQVGGGDAEFVRDPLVAHVGRHVGASGRGHAVRAEDWFGALHHQAGILGADRGGWGDDVDLPGLLIPQQRGEIVQGGVTGTRH